MKKRKKPKNFKIYVCCPKSTCKGYQDCLNFLHDWKIEPNIDSDESGHYFEIMLPQNKEFLAELDKRISIR